MPLRKTNSSSVMNKSAATTGGTAVPPQDNVVIPNNTSKAGASSNYHVHYLMSYEGMVRHQDLEFDATVGHMKGIFERIQTLGGISGKKHADANGEIDTIDDSSSPRGMLTYLQIRRCLLRMGVGWNRSLPATSDANYDDDDVSVLSFNSTSSPHSGGASASGGGLGRSDIIETDAQLIMLLAILVEIEETYRAAKMISEGGDGDSNHHSRSKNEKYQQLEQGLFLPEFIQAYKLIIGGMQSLKSIPNPNDPAESDLCNRLKERTLGMLRPFGPNSKIYNDASRTTYKEDDALSNNNHSLRSDNVEGKLLMDREAKPGLFGAIKKSFSNGDMEKLMSSKDNVLAKINEDHELEMDALASSMEELRLKAQRTRDALRKRRIRVRLFAVLVGGILIVAPIAMEMRRREFMADAIAMGREAESVADAEMIARLNAKKRELEKKLGVIEGKMRYQVNRNNDIEAQTKGIEKQIDDIDMKGLTVKADIERCFASQVEFNEDLKREQLKKDEVDEESVWCQSRLRSKERELNELQHVNAGGSEKGMIVAKQPIIEDDNATKGQQPFYLEMKYNKSIRNAMFRRQIYSAAAGLAVSALIQGLVPTVIKFFAPKAVVAVVVPPPATIRVFGKEMIIVDGIFGSSIIFLLVQAVVTFVRPL